MTGPDVRALLPDVLGEARFRPYVLAAHGDPAAATDLYLWGVELEGAWHSLLANVEVMVRNAMDGALRRWNVGQRQGGVALGEEWTAEGGTGPLVHQVVGVALKNARADAQREASRRHHGHPRRGVEPNHDDIVAQLMFGAWARLVRYPHSPSPTKQHKALWTQALRHAFPYADAGVAGLNRVGSQLETLRVLRNRVAHHENLLRVNTTARMTTALALLSAIHPDYPDLAMAKSSLRRLVKEDPRLGW